ncbi:MAG: hypothetical protein D4R57_01510 [Verrucomicrobiales bacterium]|nr:MAG: hypothetical protein D4R57_01510 [Verrucomicrobiales bacterium]
MAFEDWQKACWDIAQGGRRAGYTFYVADIIDAGESPAIEPEPLISEPVAEEAQVQPDPFTNLPSEPSQGTPSKESRTAELAGLSFRALRSIAKSCGLDTTDLNKSAQLVEAIISIEFP